MGLLDNARNVFGPLGPDLRERLVRLLDAPTSETWQAAQSIILNNNAPLLGHKRPRTLWQAVVAVDPTFPNEGPPTGQPWSRVPDALTVARAIKEATKP